jgi:hypothetical protein
LANLVNGELQNGVWQAGHVGTDGGSGAIKKIDVREAWRQMLSQASLL